MRLTAIALLALTAGPAWSQFAATGTTSVSVTVAAEAAIRIDTSTTTLTQGAVFANFTGTTNFTYKVRTTAATGAATIQLQVTSDFAPGGGPSVASPPSAGDALTYTCTVSAPATACSGAQTSSTASVTGVATFGAGATSAVSGNSGSVAWTLTNDPRYATGAYAATVTFTISAT